MGLAASQARFLAITARKADCEFRSMQIAQNKLSVTREMEQATQDYQQAINATKMVWDYDGEQSFLTDISYGFLMTPSYLNNFNPYLITNRGGQVIVDSKVAAAARYAGIDPKNGGTRNPVNMYKFIEKLAGNKIIPDKTKSELEVQIGLDDGNGGAIFRHAEDARLTRYNNDGSMNSMSGWITDQEKEAFYTYIYNNGINIGGQTYGTNTGANFDNKYNNIDDFKNGIKDLKVDGVNKYMRGMTINEILNQISCENKNGASGDKLVTINGINYVLNGSTVKTGGRYIKIDEKYRCKYDENAGYGSMPMSKNEYTDTGILGLAKRLKAEGLDFKCTNDSEDNSGLKLTSGYDARYIVDSVAKGAITLADVLTSNVSYLAIYPDGKHSYTDETKGISDNAGTFLRNAIVNIARIIYGKDGSGNWNVNTIEDVKGFDKSLYTAYTFTAKHYGILAGQETSPQITLSYSKERDSKVSEAVKDKANKVTEIVWGQNSGGDYNSSASVNLSNLLGYCLTAYDNFVTGWNSNYVIEQDIADCFFVTQDPEFKFAILSDKTETNETVMKSDFYMQLFNNLCINGFVEEKNITDNKYLEQMLKNGSYFLCGVNQQDGYFYQARYNDDVRTLIKVVNDEDAKVQAETEYTYRKMKLTAKEDRLDLEMKNIDMEIASLTAEYDSVKNLISKSVEKTFKQFES